MRSEMRGCKLGCWTCKVGRVALNLGRAEWLAYTFLMTL